MSWTATVVIEGFTTSLFAAGTRSFAMAPVPDALPAHPDLIYII